MRAIERESAHPLGYMVLSLLVVTSYLFLIHLADYINDLRFYAYSTRTQIGLLINVSGLGIMTLILGSRLSTSKNKYFSAALITIVGNVMLFAKGTLYDKESYYLDFQNLPLYMFLHVPLFFILLSTIHLYRLSPPFILNWTEKSNIRRHTSILAILQLAILAIYFVAFAPGNMSLDTYNQFSQILGTIPYNNAHPLTHTLYLQLLYTLFHSFSVFCMVQILLYVYVTTSFAYHLMLRGVNPVVLYLILVSMSLSPNVGINLMTLWKVVLFSIGLLWLTLITYKMAYTNYFSRKWHVFEYVSCMLIVGLFRFNGLPPFAAMIVYTLIHLIRTSPKATFIEGASLSITLLVFISCAAIVPGLLQAEDNPAGVKLRPIFQGLGAMYVAEEQHTLDDTTKKIMMGIAPEKAWITHYNPYFSDVYVENIPYFIENISRVGTGQALRSYGKALFDSPLVILGDRLNLSILSWSVVEDPYSYDNRYTIKLTPLMTNDFGISREENALYFVISHLSHNTTQIVFSDTFFWRVGIHLIFLLLALTLHRQLWFLYIPLFSNWLIIFLTMPAQDYRYVWFVFLIAPFLLLAYFVETNWKYKKL